MLSPLVVIDICKVQKCRRDEETKRRNEHGPSSLNLSLDLNCGQPIINTIAPDCISPNLQGAAGAGAKRLLVLLHPFLL